MYTFIQRDTPFHPSLCYYLYMPYATVMYGGEERNVQCISCIKDSLIVNKLCEPAQPTTGMLVKPGEIYEKVIKLDCSISCGI